jgi:hypothetical protein
VVHVARMAVARSSYLGGALLLCAICKEETGDEETGCTMEPAQ